MLEAPLARKHHGHGRVGFNHLAEFVKRLEDQIFGQQRLAQPFDAERFDLDLVNKVEPRLPRESPVILMDYPAAAAALAAVYQG